MIIRSRGEPKGHARVYDALIILIIYWGIGNIERYTGTYYIMKGSVVYSHCSAIASILT